MTCIRNTGISSLATALVPKHGNHTSPVVLFCGFVGIANPFCVCFFSASHFLPLPLYSPPDKYSYSFCLLSLTTFVLVRAQHICRNSPCFHQGSIFLTIVFTPLQKTSIVQVHNSKLRRVVPKWVWLHQMIDLK